MNEPATADTRWQAPSATIGRGPDLTEEVTVFVTTVGAASFAECIAHLENQDVVARFELVDHVTPLTAALQHMVDRCTTPLYVQVDEDMLLEPDAIGRLHELTGREWQPNLALVVGQLYDPHLDRNIEGVKINSHAVGRQFPWDRYASVLERNRALEASGYRIARRPLPESGERMVFGTHVLDPHPSRVFERYRRLELFRLAYPDELAWFAEYPHVFLRRVLAHGDPADYYALMGIIAANLAGDGLTASDSTLEALETFLGVEHSADRDR